MWMRSQCHENTFVVISVASIVAVLVAAVVCYEMLSHVTRCTRCWNGVHWAPFSHYIHVIAVAANVLKAVIKIWLNFSNHFCLVGLASASAVAVITFAQIWAEADPSIISWWTIFCNILVIIFVTVAVVVLLVIVAVVVAEMWCSSCRGEWTRSPV